MRLVRLPFPVYEVPPPTVDQPDFFTQLKTEMAYERQSLHYQERYRKNYCYYCNCELTFQSNTKSKKAAPANHANAIVLMEDRLPEQLQKTTIFRDPLFADVAPIPEGDKNEEARWNFSNLENVQRYQLINVLLCNKDFKKIEYLLQDDYIRTTTKFLAEMQKITADALKRQQRIQSRAYIYERK